MPSPENVPPINGTRSAAQAPQRQGVNPAPGAMPSSTVLPSLPLPSPRLTRTRHTLPERSPATPETTRCSPARCRIDRARRHGSDRRFGSRQFRHRQRDNPLDRTRLFGLQGSVGSLTCFAEAADPASLLPTGLGWVSQSPSTSAVGDALALQGMIEQLPHGKLIIPDIGTPSGDDCHSACIHGQRRLASAGSTESHRASCASAARWRSPPWSARWPRASSARALAHSGFPLVLPTQPRPHALVIGHRMDILNLSTFWPDNRAVSPWHARRTFRHSSQTSTNPSSRPCFRTSPAHVHSRIPRIFP